MHFEKLKRDFYQIQTLYRILSTKSLFGTFLKRFCMYTTHINTLWRWEGGFLIHCIKKIFVQLPLYEVKLPLFIAMGKGAGPQYSKKETFFLLTLTLNVQIFNNNVIGCDL